MRAPCHVEPVGHAGLRFFEFGAIDGVDDDALARHASSPTMRSPGSGWQHWPSVIGDAFRQAAGWKSASASLPSACALARADRASVPGTRLPALRGRATRRGRLRHRRLRPWRGAVSWRLPRSALSVSSLLFVGEDLFQNLAAEFHMLVALRVAQEAADFRARAAGDDELLPQRRRRLLLLRMIST